RDCATRCRDRERGTGYERETAPVATSSVLAVTICVQALPEAPQHAETGADTQLGIGEPEGMRWGREASISCARSVVALRAAQTVVDVFKCIPAAGCGVASKSVGL